MRADLTNAFLDELWDSLQHPPLSYMGEKFSYRSADGSYNVSGPGDAALPSVNELLEHYVSASGSGEHALRTLGTSKYPHDRGSS